MQHGCREAHECHCLEHLPAGTAQSLDEMEWERGVWPLAMKNKHVALETRLAKHPRDVCNKALANPKFNDRNVASKPKRALRINKPKIGGYVAIIPSTINQGGESWKTCTVPRAKLTYSNISSDFGRQAIS